MSVPSQIYSTITSYPFHQKLGLPLSTAAISLA